MPRNERFTFMCNKDERQKIFALATLLHRTQSDALRYLIIQALLELEKLDTQGNSSSESSEQGSKNIRMDEVGEASRSGKEVIP